MRSQSAIRLGKYKVLRLWGEDLTLLFNLEKDPMEQNDLSDLKPRKTQKLFHMMMDYFHEVDARYDGTKEPTATD